MVFDFDDFHDGNHRLDLLWKLKLQNPHFRCTVFAIPALCSEPFLYRLPSWIEIAVHGWRHDTPKECADWAEDDMRRLLNREIVRDRFVQGFKAPGWQISDGCYQVLAERGYWVADQPYNDHRRPEGLRTHLLGSPDHWHGHISDVCGNGLNETFPQVRKLVKQATTFEWISEMVSPWRSLMVA